MIIVFAALGGAFAAFCVWLAVQIVNRRKKRGIRLPMILLLAMLALYVMAVGPAFAANQQGLMSSGVERVLFVVYFPIFWLHDNGPGPTHDILEWYVGVWGA